MTDTLIPAEFKTISDTGEIEGYASTFGNRDLVGDIVQPGAFTKSLAGRAAADVLMLWGHDHKRLIGVWTEIAEDTIGLRVKGRILGDLALSGKPRSDGIDGARRLEKRIHGDAIRPREHLPSGQLDRHGLGRRPSPTIRGKDGKP